VKIVEPRIRTIAEMRANPWYSDGERVRDFIYAKEQVKLTLRCMNSISASGLFTCGAGKARTWIDLATAVSHAMELPVHIEGIEMLDTICGKPQNFAQAEMTKLHPAGYRRSPYCPGDAVVECVNLHLAKREVA